MKKILYFILLVLILIAVIINKNAIIRYIMMNYIENDLKFAEPNKYYKQTNYEFVQNTNNLYPQNKQQLLNVIYTALNIGSDDTVLYCNYKNCVDDINEITENKYYLSSINNLVHPYNNYKNIYFTISDYGRIEIKTIKQYSESEILLINKKLDEIINQYNINNLSDYDKIRVFHDYIINNTKYDTEVSIENQLYSGTTSNRAVGLLFEKKAVCSGYSDTLAIFLNRYNINNYKISSEEHIWNLVYIDGAWKHIDATWDDPVSSDGKDILLHDFFMVDTKTLKEKEQEYEKANHNFDTTIFKEAN